MELDLSKEKWDQLGVMDRQRKHQSVIADEVEYMSLSKEARHERHRREFEKQGRSQVVSPMLILFTVVWYVEHAGT